MVFAPKIKNLFFSLSWRPVGIPFGDRRCVDQPRFSTLGIGPAPAIKAGATNPKITASLRNMANLICMRSIRKPPGAVYWQRIETTQTHQQVENVA